MNWTRAPLTCWHRQEMGEIHRRRIRYERKQRSSLILWNVLESRASHLAARIIWRKVFGRTSILGKVVLKFGMVWTRLSSIFPKHPFHEVSVLQFILSLNHPGAKSLVRHRIEPIPSAKQQRRPLPALLSDSSSMWEILQLFPLT